MTATKKTTRKSRMLQHIDRAQELNVGLAEYAEAYDADRVELETENRESPLADFVAVKMAPPTSSQNRNLFTITRANGDYIEFNVWPSAQLLAALWK